MEGFALAQQARVSEETLCAVLRACGASDLSAYWTRAGSVPADWALRAARGVEEEAPPEGASRRVDCTGVHGGLLVQYAEAVRAMESLPMTLLLGEPRSAAQVHRLLRSNFLTDRRAGRPFVFERVLAPFEGRDAADALAAPPPALEAVCAALRALVQIHVALIWQTIWAGDPDRVTEQSVELAITELGLFGL